MNVLQAEKLRDIIAKIDEETGERVNIKSTFDGENVFEVTIAFKIPKEGNLK